MSRVKTMRPDKLAHFGQYWTNHCWTLTNTIFSPMFGPCVRLVLPNCLFPYLSSHYAVLFRINHYCHRLGPAKKRAQMPSSVHSVQCRHLKVSFRLLKKLDFAFRILLNAGLIVQFSSITSIFHRFILYRVTGRWSLSKI